MAVLLVAPLPVQAQQYVFEPEFSFQERYEDNLQLQVNPKQSHFISTFSPGIKLGMKTENSELMTNFRWNELLYHSQSSLNTDEQLLNANYLYSGERSSLQLAGHYRNESSLSTELDITGSGVLDVQVKKTSRFINPSFSYLLTERASIQMNYSYGDADFSESNNLNRTDYSNQQVSIAGSYQLTEKDSVNLGASYGLFESPLFNQRSETENIQLGWQHQLTERLLLSFSAGLRNTTTETEVAGSKFKRNNEGKTFAADLNYNRERGNLSFHAGQQLTPASTGEQQQSTSFALNGNYLFSERWSTSLAAQYFINESINGNNSNRRVFFNISPRIRWRWNDEVKLELGYSYRRQEFDNSDQPSVGNSVIFQFIYQPLINNQVK